MNEKEFARIWENLDSKINVINERTKEHTLDIREIKKKLKNDNK